MFDTLDQDQNGTLDREEFSVLMTILCSQIMSRVILQISMTIMIVPLISEHLVDVIKFVLNYLRVVFLELDDDGAIRENIKGILDRCWDGVILFIPPIIQGFSKSCYESFDGAIMDGIPLTIMSCALGCLIVPWSIYKCDEFFNDVATKRSKKQAS